MRILFSLIVLILLGNGNNCSLQLNLFLSISLGVPLVSGCLNVSLHRHLGPVTILLSLTPGAAPQSSTSKSSNRNANGNKSRRNSFESKSAEAESIYGLYADLMKVDDYISEPRSTTASTASTAIATSVTGSVSNSAMSVVATNPNGQPLPSNNIHQIQLQQQKLNGANQVTNRMAWDFNNMTISDDSTSESASSSAIYHDGVRQLGAINQQQQSTTISQNPLGHDTVNNNSKADSVGNRSTAANSVQNIYEPKRPRSAQSAQMNNNNFNPNANNYNNSTASNSNLRAQSTNSNGRPGSVNNGGTADSNSIYESNVNFGSQLTNNQQANGTPMNHHQNYYNNNESSSNLKTALLITGGNGFKQFNQAKPSFTSQHAHAIIWEFRI